MNIRKANEQDVNALARLDSEWKSEGISSGFVPRSRLGFLKAIKNDIVFVAEADKVIGYILGVIKLNRKARYYLGKNEPYMLLDSVYVLKGYRNKKVGNRLVKALITESRKRKIKTIMAVADNINVEKIIAFYKHIGFDPLFLWLKYSIES